MANKYLALFMLFILLSCRGQNKQPNISKMGAALHSAHFDVTVNKYWIMDELKINRYYILPKEYGVKYFIVNLTYSNRENESQKAQLGYLAFKRNDSNIYYDALSFNTPPPGWCSFDNPVLNPSVPTQINMIFKIPANLSGSGYYITYPDNWNFVELGDISAISQTVIQEIQ